MLPEVRSSSEVYGDRQPVRSASADVPIAGIAGDQQAALFGQMCRQPGMSKNTYGTGCFLLQNIGTDADGVAPSTGDDRRVADRRRAPSTRSKAASSSAARWCSGCATASASSGRRPRSKPLAASVPDNGGVYLVPAFAGLGAPHWDPYARGTIVGITRGTTAAHIARAALESIAFQVADLLDAMDADAGIPLKELRVDGGAASNNTLMQIPGRPARRAGRPARR